MRTTSRSVPLGDDWQSTFQERVDGITVRLSQGPIPLPTPQVQAQGGAVQFPQRRYELMLSRDARDQVAAALELARGGDPSISAALVDTTDGVRGEIGVDGLLTHTLIIRWKATAPAALPRVALVVDDMGNDLLVARQLVSLEVPITLAVMPFRPYSREVAELAHLFQRDVLLHLPMEAQDGEEHGEEGILRLDANRGDLLRQLDESLASVPYVIGVNNHMGSRFTQDRERMGWVLQRLKDRKLFFLDSVTSPKSIAKNVAGAVGIPYLARQEFLDDAADVETVDQRLSALVQAARQRGAAIGIGHPHAATVEALKAFGARAQSQGVQVVPLSNLLGTTAAKPPAG